MMGHDGPLTYYMTSRCIGYKMKDEEEEKLCEEGLALSLCVPHYPSLFVSLSSFSLCVSLLLE